MSSSAELWLDGITHADTWQLEQLILKIVNLNYSCHMELDDFSSSLFIAFCKNEISLHSIFTTTLTGRSGKRWCVLNKESIVSEMLTMRRSLGYWIWKTQTCMKASLY